MSESLITKREPETVHVRYHLILFVAGNEPNSVLARQNLEDFCSTELGDHYELQVMNVFEDHRSALAHRVLVTPCLVMLEPQPTVMVAGTLQDKEKLRLALRIKKEE
jgi:circadian clock protein KaiB